MGPRKYGGGGLCPHGAAYFLIGSGEQLARLPRRRLGFGSFFAPMIVATLLAAATPVAGWLAAYRARELLLGQALSLLGGWALVNLLGSGYQLPRTDRRTAAHPFPFLNCCWGFINAILAAVGILRTHPGAPPLDFGAADAAYDHQRLVLIFLVNAGLDLGYLAVGWWLVARATRPTFNPLTPPRLLGYGRSLWVQGGFLLVFDAAMGLLFHYHR
jgi:hypothetical protein